MLYSKRQTLYGDDEYIISVAGKDIGSVWWFAGAWHLTPYVVPGFANKLFGTRGLAIDALLITQT